MAAKSFPLCLTKNMYHIYSIKVMSYKCFSVSQWNLFLFSIINVLFIVCPWKIHKHLSVISFSGHITMSLSFTFDVSEQINSKFIERSLVFLIFERFVYDHSLSKYWWETNDQSFLQLIFFLLKQLFSFSS